MYSEKLYIVTVKNTAIANELSQMVNYCHKNIPDINTFGGRVRAAFDVLT